MYPVGRTERLPAASVADNDKGPARAVPAGGPEGGPPPSD